MEIKILRHVRAESSRRPPRHRRGACSMAWRCRFLTARPSQELSALVDFHTGADGSAVARLCADASLEDADVAAALWDLIVAGTATTAELASEALKIGRGDGAVDATALVEDVARACVEIKI